MMKIGERIILVLLLMAIGLAPFYPEPHIVGKIRWVWGGAVGMSWIDWFDFLFHGIPWLIILFLLIKWSWIALFNNNS